jgi:phosphoribosylformylglycinamidine synthase
LLPLNKFRRNAKPNDMIVLAGGKTGRDGIHGVTFASAELTEKSEEVSRPAVQIANPIEEEKVKRAIVEVRDSELASSITDLGGGGLSSAVGETANKFECGAFVDLDRVPVKYAGLAPWEIYVSESQERMLLTVPLENLNRVLRIFKKEDVETVAIGKLTSEKTLMLKYNKQRVAKIEIAFLFEPPKTTKTAEYTPAHNTEPIIPEPKDMNTAMLQILSSPNVASKERVVRTYDHEVKGNTVLKPLQGMYAGPNDAAVLKPLTNSWKGVAISSGINPNYGKIDPYWMTASAIDEAIRNNLAVGGRRIALLDNFTWGNPERPERLGSLVKACEACYDFATAYKTPFISGKDSLYNESPLGPVTPTILITALGILPDVRSAISVDLKTPGSPVYIVGTTYNELGGSEYYRLKAILGKNTPEVRANQARKTFSLITRAIDSGFIKSCHDLSEGGLGVAASEMALAGNLGINLDLRKVPAQSIERDDTILFSESNSRFLIEVAAEAKGHFEALVRDKACSQIGKVTRKPQLCIRGHSGRTIVDIPVKELATSWKRTLIGEDQA